MQQQPSRQQRIETVLNLPLHRHLGVTSIESSEGQAELQFEVGENTLNPAGALHGGALYMLCDVCAYAGLLSVLEDNEEAVTHDIHVSVMRSAGAGDNVVIRSTLLKRGRSLCFVDISASVGGKVIATARVTKSVIRS